MTKEVTAERLAAIEATLKAGQALTDDDARALLAEVRRARRDADQQTSEADYWREGYRLTKGLSNDEVGAIIAARDASKAHARPCWFPQEACGCEDSS